MDARFRWPVLTRAATSARRCPSAPLALPTRAPEISFVCEARSIREPRVRILDDAVTQISSIRRGYTHLLPLERILRATKPPRTAPIIDQLLPPEPRVHDRVEDRSERVGEANLQLVFIATAQPAKAQQHFLGGDASARNRELIAQPARGAFDRQ